MANQEHLDILKKQGVDEWNQWREDYPDIIPDLRGADLSGAFLSGANLSEANLSGATLSEANFSKASLNWAKLSGAKLSGANLSEATLSGATLSEATLSGATLIGANLIGANLSGAFLSGADLSEATLSGANFSKANLSGADLSGAKLSGANLSEANLYKANLRGADLSEANLNDAIVSGVKYRDRKPGQPFLTWLYPRSIMRGKYLGIRVASCYGNAIFKRDAEDQDFLDTLEDQWKRTWRIGLFWLWGKIDYGRSMLSVVVIAVLIIGVFGFIYCRNPDMIFYGSHHKTPFTPFYFSIVTFTTLGFGDVTANGWVGEMVVSLQVILGYVTLGLLISILANKVARRS